MEFLGSDVAEQRVRERKQRCLYAAYGDLQAYEAVKVRVTPHTLRAAYYAAAVAGRTVYVCGGMLDDTDHEFAQLDPAYASDECCSFEVTSGGLEFCNSNHLPALSRIGHSLVICNGRLVCYGGSRQSHSLFSDVILVDATLGSALKVAKNGSGLNPNGRLRHAACAYRHHMYIHGGQCHTSGTTLLRDLWRFDASTLQWEQLPYAVNTESLPDDLPTVVSGFVCTRPVTAADRLVLERGPGERFGHHMTYYNNALYIACGSDGHNALLDFWRYDLATQHWNYVSLLDSDGVPTCLIEGRIDCAATRFADNRWLFHGGIDGCGEFARTMLEVNLETHECRSLRIAVTSPPDSSSSASESDPHCLLSLRGHTMLNLGDSILLLNGVCRARRTNSHIYQIFPTGSEMRLSRKYQAPEVCRQAISSLFTTPGAADTDDAESDASEVSGDIHSVAQMLAAITPTQEWSQRVPRGEVYAHQPPREPAARQRDQPAAERRLPPETPRPPPPPAPELPPLVVGTSLAHENAQLKEDLQRAQLRIMKLESIIETVTSLLNQTKNVIQ